MATASYFTDAQAQFDESQKKFAALWEESQKQVMESQKKLMSSWMSSLPNMTAQVNISETIEKTLDFQRQLIDSSLDAQQASTRLSVEAQKQFWDSYFKTTQKMAQDMPKV